MLRPVLVTGPAALPVVAADLIAQTPALADANATAVGAMIGAATAWLDGWSGVLGRCLVTQTWRQDFRCWKHCMRLPFPEARNVAVAYQDAADTAQSLGDDLFDIVTDAIGPFIRFRRSFVAPTLFDDRADPISVRFDTGYGEPEEVPAAIRQAIGMMVVNMAAQTEENGGLRSFEVTGAFVEQYNSPQMMSQVSNGLIDMLLAPYRVVSV